MDNNNQIYRFCTIFDSSYYTKGLALYYSLEKVCNFHLYIFTPDAECYTLLEQKKLPNATLIHLSEIEDDELTRIKTERDVAEYFWTIKATCIKYLFEKRNLDLVSYVDADIFFYSSPSLILNEMGNKSVLITPHNFSPQYIRESKNGIYNAGFISFRNDHNGLNALNWWNQRCREWCFKRKENGKFGDQLYLEELSNFNGVHTLLHKGILANWNIQQFQFEVKDGAIYAEIEDNETFEVLFFHFHYLKFFNSREVELGRKYISPEAYNIFYKPYIKYLLELAPFDMQGAVDKTFSWKAPILFVLRKLKNTYNIIPLAKLSKD